MYPVDFSILNMRHPKYGIILKNTSGGNIKMKKMYYHISKMLFGLAMVAATLSVNVTCNRRYYQEKLSNQLGGVRKYKDE